MKTTRTYSINRRTGPRAAASAFRAAALVAGLVFLAAQGAPAQERGISLNIERLPLRQVCDTLVSSFGVPLVFLDADVSAETVSVRCDNCTVESLLDDILEDTPLYWKRINRQYIISRRPAAGPRPEGTLWGTVTDSATGEPVADALILLFREEAAEPLRVASANGSGFFSLRNVPAGGYRLVSRMVGFREGESSCDLAAGASSEVPVSMAERRILLREVVVRGRRAVFSLSEAVSRGVYVPATPSDRNQYYLDGGRIYNPAHYGALVSTFNEEAFNEVDPRTGGIPPHYGGRIGGVLDLSMREGSSAGIGGLATVGTLGSALALHGPLAGPVTFMVSGRQGYPSVAGTLGRTDDPVTDARATEVISKFTWRTSTNGRLSLTGYFGRDNYANAPQADWGSLTNDITWRNAAVGLRWSGAVPPALFLQVSAGFTGYDLNTIHGLTNFLAFPPITEYRSDYRIEDFTLRADAEHYYDSWHTIRGGVEVVRHAMSGKLSPFTTQGALLPWDDYSSWELSLYMQDRWQLLPRVLAELGARATNFQGAGGSHSAVDPRFSLFVSASDDVTLHAGVSSVTQFVHPYDNSGLFLFYPSVFWYPSTDSIRPSSSMQVSAGADRAFGDGDYSVGLGAYYRLTRDAHEFVYEQDPYAARTIEETVVHGDERAWGVRLSFRARTDRLDAFVGYNLSWLTQQFDELNGGRSFVPRFHRRHEVVAEVGYAVGGMWSVGALAVVASDQSPSYSQVTDVEGHAGAMDLYDLNGSRLPGFERLELRLTRHFDFPGAGSQISLRMLSDFGIVDPYVWELEFSTDAREIWRATLREGDLLPRYPVLTVSLNI